MATGDRFTRRRLIGAAGAGAVGAAALGAGLRVGAGAGGDEEDPRNVLLIVVDTLRADHVGAYGQLDVRTPNIDALAAAGTRFTRMYPEAMPTMPMRRTIMTGRRMFPFNDWHPWAGVGGSPGWGPIMPGSRTLVDDFSRAGYSTSYVTDNPFIGFAEALGPFRDTIDHLVPIPGHAGMERPKSSLPERHALRVLPARMRDKPKEVATMRDYLAQNGGANGLDIDEARTPAARVFEAAIENLRRVGRPRRDGRARRPFFMVVDSFDPHEPWVPPRKYRALYGDPDEPFIGNLAYGPAAERMTPDEIERLQRTYKASVSLVDAQIGRLLDRLERLGLEEETTVMLVSDHGILLGERDWIGKSAWLLGPEMIHVPLIVRHPGGEDGVVSDWLVSTPDVPPTLMGLAGLRPRRRYEGTDLSPIVDGGDPPGARALAYGGYANDFYVRDDRWSLVSDNRMAGSQLYDLRNDPGELHDVSDENPEVVARLRERMLARVPEPPRFYRAEEFEREPRLIGDVIDSADRTTAVKGPRARGAG